VRRVSGGYEISGGWQSLESLQGKKGCCQQEENIDMGYSRKRSVGLPQGESRPSGKMRKIMDGEGGIKRKKKKGLLLKMEEYKYNVQSKYRERASTKQKGAPKRGTGLVNHSIS